MLMRFCRNVERSRQVTSHRVRKRLQLRSFGDHDDVDVRDSPTTLVDDCRGTAQEVQAGRASPYGVRIGKMASNVSRPRRTEYASVTAWQTASASEWPRRPRSFGIVTPPRINGRPATSLWRSYLHTDPNVLRLASRTPLRNRLGNLQVIRNGDLDVRRLAFHQPDGMSGAFGQRRLVGRRFIQRQRVAQYSRRNA